MKLKNLLWGLLIIVILLGGIFTIYNQTLIFTKNTYNAVVLENIEENNNTGDMIANKTYTFNKNISGDWVTQIDEGSIKIIVKNDLLKKYCEKGSDFDGCMELWMGVISQGVSLNSDGWIITSENDGSIKVLSNIKKEEIDNNIAINNCFVLGEEIGDQNETLLGYDSGVQSLDTNNNYDGQYCNYATNIIVDNVHNKTILIRRSHQDSALLPNMSVIEYL